MTSKPVINTLSVCTKSELSAMLKLVQRINEVPESKARWKEDCRVAFGWSPEAVDVITNNLRKMASRVLSREELEL